MKSQVNTTNGAIYCILPAIQTNDNECQYPLYAACSYNQSKGVVIKLINEFSEAAKQKILTVDIHCI
jgi:hypothetical protein